MLIVLRLIMINKLKIYYYYYVCRNYTRRGIKTYLGGREYMAKYYVLCIPTVFFYINY